MICFTDDGAARPLTRRQKLETIVCHQRPHTAENMEPLHRPQLKNRRAHACPASRDVQGDPERAGKIGAESPEDYAGRRNRSSGGRRSRTARADWTSVSRAMSRRGVKRVIRSRLQARELDRMAGTLMCWRPIDRLTCRVGGASRRTRPPPSPATMRKVLSASVIESKKASASIQMLTCGMFVINARTPPKTKVSRPAFPAPFASEAVHVRTVSDMPVSSNLANCWGSSGRLK